jgi:hypothetical protein
MRSCFGALSRLGERGVVDFVDHRVRKVKVLEFKRDYISTKPFHCSCKKILPFPWSQRNSWILAEIRMPSVFCEFVVNLNIVVSFHRTVALIRRLEDDEVERQLKCEIHDTGLCILGCFEECHRKVQFS